MSRVGEIERMTQNRVVRLFTDKLGYQYLGNLQDKDDNKNVETRILRNYLKRKGYSENLIERAINILNRAVRNQTNSLYDINKEVYGYLRYGVEVRETIGENKQTVKLINWDDVYDNEFYIAEEVSIKGEHTKRPDIVLYVNGIALGVLELKRSTVAVAEGIRQNLENQESIFIKPFFNTMQLILAGNDTEGLRYGTIETKEQYYLTWKEDKKAEDRLSREVRKLGDEVEHILDQQLIGFCHKERFLEIIYYFVVFDRGIKKLCRPSQYFGVKAAMPRIKNKESGIIWHTQGSGKSLIMVWIAKWIRENISDSRVLIITDRDELDKQIEKVFKGVEEDIYRTKSGKDLIERFNQTTPLMLCSLIHKFGSRGEKDDDTSYDDYIDELKSNLPPDFKAKGDIYVFVDECHRTQSGKLHTAMREILPDSMFIGFTGTPLLKKDKATSIEVFGSYIHTYKFDEAVKDEVVLDLCYEARDIEQDITSQEKIDQWFEAKTRGLTDYAKNQLKQRWGTMQRVLSSKSRLEQIVKDIIFDMETKDRLQNGQGNAMLIAGSIYEACKYYELFQATGFTKCAMVTSYVPNIRDIKGETTGEDKPTENVEKYRIYQDMLKGKSPQEFEEEAKRKFVEQPAQLKLLIVVDKLLTGFDAPPATYLYIDKSMKDHGLFQAICRVNRIDGDGKEYGYIVDYMDLFKSLEKSVQDYTSEAFADYDKEDVEGLLKNRLEKARERLDEALEKVKALCEPVAPPKGTLQYIRYFCWENIFDEKELKDNEPKRLALYQYTTALIRAYANIANEMEEVGYTAKEIADIKNDVEHFNNARREVMLAADDDIDLKSYEPAMRHLIDNYISAEDSKQISAFENMTLVDLIVDRGVDFVQELPANIKKDEEAAAETIENNVRRLIVDQRATNPRYYDRMSALLEEVIRQRKAAAISYQEHLKRVVEIARRSKNPATVSEYPATINTQAKRALYDNLDKNIDLAISLDKKIREEAPSGWKDNDVIKERMVRYLIKRYIDDDQLAEEVFRLAKEQEEY
jgi:type I restriction enzyme R subunit